MHNADNYLTALSPLDGRYGDKLTILRDFFSEFALIKYRVKVEVAWLQFLSREAGVVEVPTFNDSESNYLDSIANNFSLADAHAIKAIEKNTRHDVKAVEYFIKNKLAAHASLCELREFVHFACTSEDINNVAYALMLKDARAQLIIPKLMELTGKLQAMAVNYQDIPMLARTHGQDASPTTVGKELYYFYKRCKEKIQAIVSINIKAKFNGAVGNYNAHVVAYPQLNWPDLTRKFIEAFGLTWNACTTQIEPHDYMADLFALVANLNNILLDFCRDMWGYIALGYFQQAIEVEAVGSSTMPHKVNPICFENAEGNLGLANAILQHMANKLPISRWQRDLSDSTVLRNIGVGLGHAYLAYTYILQGMETIAVNAAQVCSELDNKWHLLAEAVQTVMRKHKISNAYEQLKALTRGETINKETLDSFIMTLAIPETEKQNLLRLTVQTYIGILKTMRFED